MGKISIVREFIKQTDAYDFENQFLNERGLNKPGIEVCVYYPIDGNKTFKVEAIAKESTFRKHNIQIV